MSDTTGGKTIIRPLVRSSKRAPSAPEESEPTAGHPRILRPPAPRGRSWRTRSRLVGLAFVAVLALAVCFPFRHAVYWLGDEGILLRGGAEMLAGKKLYTDFFEFYPPAGLLITEAWLSMFGHSFAAARALAITSIVGVSCFAYLACAAVTEGVLLPAALTGLWLIMSQGKWTIVDHHWLTTCFSMMAVWLSLLGARRAEPGTRTSFMAGMISGAAAMVTPTRGGLAALAAVGSHRNHKLQMAACLAGCAIVPIVCLAYIVLNGELLAGYADIIRFPAINYGGIQGIGFASGVAAKTLPLAFLYPLAPVLPLIVVARNGRAALNDRVFRCCLLFALAGFVGAFPRPDIVHIAFAAPLALPLLAYCTSQITKTWRRLTVYAAGAIGLMLCLPAAGSYVRDARAAWATPASVTAAGPISFIGDHDAPELFALIERTPPNDTFLFYPYLPLAPFIARREHVSKFDMFVPEYTPPDQYAEACASANARATWLVLDRTGMDPALIKAIFPAVRNPSPPETRAFEREIGNDFRLVAKLGRYEIRKRAAPSPARPCGV